ncbi:MAG: mechanosensitive ion channel family protein, partial [Deltaproteobacteria bacterium]|nr:mechanosensitive ion channel family protein [Deltaproteobacteria bacterium]
MKARVSVARGLHFAFLAFLLMVDLGGAARAQTPSEVATQPATVAEGRPVEDFSRPMGPPDPFNRGTPRGSMYGYLTAARARDYERAAEYLDLRRLPLDQQDRGPELARRLKVVLDQTMWIDVGNLSDSNAGTPNDTLPEWQNLVGDIETKEGTVSILMQRVPRAADGQRIWKISAGTVALVPELHAEFEPLWLEEWLPPVFFEHEPLGMELWKWLALLVVLAIASLISLTIAGTATRLIGLIFTRGQKGVDSRIVHLLRGPVRLALTVVLFELGRRPIGLALNFGGALALLESVLLVVAAAWLLFRLIDLAVLAMRIQAERRGNPGVIPVLVPGARFAKLSIILIGLLGVLGTLGVNISAAVAGLGVGGIAVALAAQKTIENLIGGISLFADRPVSVGDFCRWGDQVGTVEEIGLRSTRIRTLERTVVTVPNAVLSQMELDNFTKRDRRLLRTTLQLRYETTPDQMRFILAKLRELLISHPMVTPDPARVRFTGFDDYSKNVDVFAYLICQDQNTFLAIQEDIFLRMEDIINAAGSGFAFPSQTAYLARDPEFDDRRVDEAVAEVEQWRAAGKLPFPDFEEEERERISNVLPYPPEGSPAHRPRARRSD